MIRQPSLSPCPSEKGGEGFLDGDGADNLGLALDGQAAASRGDIYEDKVLAKMLKEGILAGADVFEDEPDIDGNPLLECDTAILTPHTAGADTNADAIEMVMKFNIDNIFKLADGTLPDSIVNPEAVAGEAPQGENLSLIQSR